MKRMFDLFASIVLLFLFFPFFVLISFSVLFLLGHPIFFVQQRPGFNGKPFKLIKFRTMLHKKDKLGRLLEDKDRLTNFGLFLRSTSMDELPELFNVLKGDMSFVGPRPLLMEYMELYDDKQRKRHDIRPGITGWAQINGRNNISWQRKFDLDIWYIENKSFLLDLKILFLTFKKVIFREGVSQEGTVTAKKFEGNE